MKKISISNIKNVITTNRLLIRPIQMDDLNDIYMNMLRIRL